MEPGKARCHQTVTELGLEPTVSTLIRIYEKLAHYEYEKQCSITKLNSEALSPIMQYLDTIDRQNVRLTCKSFKIALDECVGIHVNLDQRKIDSSRGALPPPGASSLRLWSIHTPQYLDYLLKRWYLITQVHFAGQVNLSAFTKVVTRCRNLCKITFTDRCHMYAGILPVRISQLHTLDIGCPGYGSDYVGSDALVCSIWNTYELLLKKLTLPHLKVFRIYFCSVETCTILHQAVAQIFRFLSTHFSVEDFSLSLHHRYERFNFLANDVNFRRFRIDVPKRLLKRIQLQKIHIETMEAAFRIWDWILPGQKVITHLDIVNRGRRWFYYSKLISNNYGTLKVIRLHNISPAATKTPVIDARVFEGCKVLETLFLSRFENSTQEVVYCYPNEHSEFAFLDTDTSTTAEVENLTALPSTLRNLHIQGLVLSTHEICSTLKNLKHLQTLELQLVGYYKPSLYADIESIFSVENDTNNSTPENGLGVSGLVIQCVLHQCRHLDTLFIEEFENPWTKIRDTKLGEKIHEISYIGGDGFFKSGNYYGVLICPEISRNSGHLTRAERMHLWNVRLSQYTYDYCPGYGQQRSRKASTSNITSGHNPSEDNYDPEDDEPKVFDPVSSTSLLEMLDKENGQLEQIQRMLQAQTPTPEAPDKVRAEETRKLAQKYFNTLYCAIPNYHKASRLLEPKNEKFTSFVS